MSREISASSRLADCQRRLVQRLIRRSERGDFSWSDAVTLAMHFLRSESLVVDHRRGDKLKEVLSSVAPSMGEPVDHQALESLAQTAVTLATAPAPARHPGARLNEGRQAGVVQDRKTLARAAVYAELTNGKNADDIVRRAVTRALRESKRKPTGRRRLSVDEASPLRRLLDLPSQGDVWLAKEDIRRRMTSPRVLDVLERASLFDEKLLRPVLGEDLFFLARPIGFLNSSETGVLLRVTSSVAAQEANLRQSEILRRLRTLDGFRRVRTLRFDVKIPARKPVVGKPPKA